MIVCVEFNTRALKTFGVQTCSIKQRWDFSPSVVVK